MRSLFTIIGILAVLFGLAVLAGTVILFLRKYLMMKNAIAATGVVVHVEVSQTSNSNGRATLYKPTVRFQTADGRVVDYTPMMAISGNYYSVGDNLPIHYDPRQPQKASLGGNGSWFPFLIGGFVGGMFTLVGAIFILVSRA